MTRVGELEGEPVGPVVVLLVLPQATVATMSIVTHALFSISLCSFVN
jgi:hypothetical protein